ncbi:MAG: hypothetical protein A2275_19125 [Bacteroidetes bacterium RIFOXYA12_FULL_35_11]|nr:MAG: hypothetical protein A2X01_08225 [Bacteroidetes bacterium GWF2_35_48]OFY75691.1 MAG: hypothetical protein A2275_19125 [Bacteroidetes bacterium RIFOXYA12_FULL_35_11]OFY93043.1 MAG: hypothetical protein A2309_13635 [Bacteroidetes bacterium RIFOXYB2_FULL_35_7]
MENKELEYTKLFDSYFNNELSVEEKELVEKRLKEDPEFADNFKLHKELSEVLAFRNKADELREKLKKIQQEVEQEQSSSGTIQNSKEKIFNLNWWFRVAAIFILICVSTALIYYFTSKPDVNDLFDKYYRPHVLAENRGLSGNDTAMTLTAYSFYKSKNYKEAGALFLKISITDPDDLQAFLLAGICSMEIKDYNTAINTFLLLQQKDNILYNSTSQWYLGLCYLKTNNITEAKKVFTELQQEESGYKIEVNDILTVLGK